MKPNILKTDGGPHSPETWANLTANQIVVIDPSASDELLQAANKFRAKIAQTLAAHHQDVQIAERAKLTDTEHLASECKPDEKRVNDAIKAVIEDAKGTPFADHFKRDDVKDYLRRLIEQHLRCNMDVERSWHADGSDHPTAVAYRKARTEHGPDKAHIFINQYRESAAPRGKKAKGS